MKESLTMQQVCRVLANKWWVVLICAILCGSLTFAYSSYVVAPEYTSIGTMIVNNRQDSAVASINVNDLQASQRLVSTYAIILKSDAFINRVKQKTDLPYSVSEIQNMITYTSVNNTEVLAVAVESKNPEHAAIIVESILDLGAEEISKYAEVGSVKILDHANLPESPSSPDIPMNTVVGILLGIILSVIALVILEISDTRIKGADDLSGRYKLPILGIIPTAEDKEENSDAKQAVS